MNIQKQEPENLYEHYSFNADKGQSPLRVDKFLMNFIENTSRNKIQLAAKAGNIWVNKKIAKPNYKVKALDVVQVLMSTPNREYEIVAENIPLDILYEDEALIILNKSPGMVVHPGCGNYSGTLVHALKYHFETLGGAQSSIRPGLVHRIDKNTSGLLVIAKDDYSLEYLAKQFFFRTIKRQYFAFVWGNVAKEEGTIVGNIGRSLRDRKKMQVFEEEKIGKPAITHYKVLERFGFLTFVSCKLETGRTHQIRVHFKHIGHPLFNDEQYMGNTILKKMALPGYEAFIENCFTLLPRQALHAFSLGFIHPNSKKELYFESPLPDDMKELLEKCQKFKKANALSWI